MIRGMYWAPLWLAVALTLAVVIGSLSQPQVGGAQPVPDGARATVAQDAVTVQVSVVIDEERAGSADFHDTSQIGDTPVGRSAVAGEQTVAVIDRDGTEIDRGRTDRFGRVVLDGLVGVPFVVAVGGIDAYSGDKVLSDGEPLDLSVVTYVSERSRAASLTSSSAPYVLSAGTQSVIPVAAGAGDPALPPTSESGVPGGIWPVLVLLGGTIFLVSIATRVTTRLQTSRR